MQNYILTYYRLSKEGTFDSPGLPPGDPLMYASLRYPIAGQGRGGGRFERARFGRKEVIKAPVVKRSAR